MKDYVIAIKDRYQNVYNGQKVKVLTKGKKYVYLRIVTGHYTIVNDLDITSNYRKELFTTKSKARDNKLKCLGI